MQEEKLKFAVTLSGTYWDRKPQFSIWLDDHVVTQSEIVSQDPQTVNFEHTVDPGAHTLKIRLENKTNSDTLLENGTVVKDMLLNIDDITIDDISLGILLWSAEYIPDTPQQYKGQLITKLDNCVNLGWNGTYILKFDSPFYIWLVEKF
jgi:hypothetical protein